MTDKPRKWVPWLPLISFIPMLALPCLIACAWWYPLPARMLEEDAYRQIAEQNAIPVQVLDSAWDMGAILLLEGRDQAGGKGLYVAEYQSFLGFVDRYARTQFTALSGKAPKVFMLSNRWQDAYYEVDSASETLVQTGIVQSSQIADNVLVFVSFFLILVWMLLSALRKR